jgi:hypothetical protein
MGAEERHVSHPEPLRIHAVAHVQIDKLCDEWEGLLKQQQSPAMGEYLRRVAPVDQEQLFNELLFVELEYTDTNQKRATIKRYLAQFPQFSNVLATALLQVEEANDKNPTAPVLPHDATWHLHNSAGLGQIPSTTDSSQGFPATSASGSCQFGRYTLLDELGVGGFGRVYRAFDRTLERTVALKIPREGVLSGPEAKARFIREARSAARLDHVGIVHVFEVGQLDDTPFIVTEYIEGESLKYALEHRRFTVQQAVEVVIQLADALEHAHGRQVVHRDLTAANIMLDRQGRPRITDFGLAKRQVEGVTLTHEGNLLGTVGYMSPEQAEGHGRHSDRRTDVYSLGVILFELLSGELPFRGTAVAVLRQITQTEPPHPSTLRQEVNRDLDTICLKCLEKSPSARYSTAEALGHDLRLWLEGRPITARPVGIWGTASRWCRRQPLLSALMVAFVTLLAAGGIMLYWNASSAHVASRRLMESYVDAMRTATAEFVPQILDATAPFRAPMQERVQQELRRTDLPDKQRARLCLFLNELTPEQLRFLQEYSLTVNVDELLLTQSIFDKRNWGERSWFRSVLSDRAESPQRRLRAAAMLAAPHPASPNWDELAPDVARLLLTVPATEVRSWQTAFHRVAPALRQPLQAIFLEGAEDPQTLHQAAALLAWMSIDKPSGVAQLLLSTDSAHLPTVFNVARIALAEQLVLQSDLTRDLREWPGEDTE